MKRIVQTENAPKAIGPYSQAVEANGFLFVSGQLGMDPATGQLAEGVEGQTRQAMQNIEAILGAAGIGFGNVVRAGIFVADMGDFQKVNAIYGSFFTSDPPARATVEVGRLPKDALVEIEATAVLG